MKPAVRFDHVSKKYRLGTGHVSLGSLLRRPWQMFRNGDDDDADERKVLWALRDVSFAIQPGEALGLVGPNGSGKTTALKILSKITQPTSGKVDVNGRISALIELGAGFHADLTGRENVYLNATILGMPRKKIDESFDRIVEFAGLARFIDTPVKRYSSGMYVRLGFSVAAHVEPDILLVDEVLAVGDAQFRQKCAVRIEELQNRGTTIVFVAHNLYLVKSVCNTAVFILKGDMKQYGPVDDVINTYQNWLNDRQIETVGQHDPLSNEKRQNSPDIKMTGVEIRNMQGEEADTFDYNEPAEIQIHFDVKKPINKPNIVTRIRRADGTTACMIRTADYGYQLDDLVGKCTASIIVDPLQLATGAYIIEVTLIGAVDGVGIAVGQSRWFQVAGVSFGHEELSGVFVPRVASAQVHENTQMAAISAQ